MFGSRARHRVHPGSRLSLRFLWTFWEFLMFFELFFVFVGARWVSLDRPCSIFFKTLLRVRRARIGLVYSSVGGFAVRVLGAGFDFVPAIVVRLL